MNTNFCKGMIVKSLMTEQGLKKGHLYEVKMVHPYRVRNGDVVEYLVEHTATGHTHIINDGHIVLCEQISQDNPDIVA